MLLYPMPSFDQSVARQVGRPLSKMVTPLVMSLKIDVFDASNASACVLVQSNFSFGFSRSRKGFMVVDILKAYETWFTLLACI